MGPCTLWPSDFCSEITLFLNQKAKNESICHTFKFQLRSKIRNGKKGHKTSFDFHISFFSAYFSLTNFSFLAFTIYLHPAIYDPSAMDYYVLNIKGTKNITLKEEDTTNVFSSSDHTEHGLLTLILSTVGHPSAV